MKQESKRAPWKKKEPYSMSGKERAAEDRSIFERARMEERSTQNVVVKFNKYLIVKELVHSFTVNMKIPLRRTEVMERMGAAFPGLEIRTEES